MLCRSVLFTTFCFVILIFHAQAGDDKKIVPSTLRSATVYLSGAELMHTATAWVNQGSNEILIDNISNNVDPASIRVSCNGSVTVMSVAFYTEYLQTPSTSLNAKKWQDSIDVLKKELGKVEITSKSDEEILDLLNSNKSKLGSKEGLSVAELTKMVDYYRQKITEIRTELNGCQEKKDRLNQLIDKLDNQLKEEEKKNGRTAGRISVQLLSPADQNVALTVSYLTPTAWWIPFYDLKVDGNNQPLRIIYKAKLVQTSGIDWKQVKLSLSTAAPAQHAEAPLLKTWTLQFIDPVAAMERSLQGNYMTNTLQGNVKGLDFRSASILKEPVVNTDDILKKLPSGKEDLGDYVAVRDTPSDINFDIDIPYDVPGNGKEQGIVLQELKAPCSFQYYSVPKLDKEAFLLGQLPAWEALNLLPGEANIIIEGSYAGKTFINPNTTVDTMNLTLGVDKRVTVKREKVVDFSSVKFMGSNKKQVFTYEITVRNNRKEAIAFLLKDQHPVSSNKDIEEELLVSTGAAVNEETGVLTWQLNLAPGESKKVRVSYSIKYPKDKLVNVN